jgi:hypothetical protein
MSAEPRSLRLTKAQRARHSDRILKDTMMLLPGIFINQAKASRNPTKANSMKIGDIPCRRLMNQTDEETNTSDEE